MLAIENHLQLAYDGTGEHRILGLVKEGSAGNSTKELAEYILRQVDYAGRAPGETSFVLASGTVEATLRPEAACVRHIHRDCKEEIESRWSEKAMTNDEVNELLFRDSLEKELNRLPSKHKAKIELSF